MSATRTTREQTLDDFRLALIRFLAIKNSMLPRAREIAQALKAEKTERAEKEKKPAR